MKARRVLVLNRRDVERKGVNLERYSRVAQLETDYMSSLLNILLRRKLTSQIRRIASYESASLAVIVSRTDARTFPGYRAAYHFVLYKPR